jgi:hypothetical protein
MHREYFLLFYNSGIPVGCSYFKNIMIPTHTPQITFSGQAVRSSDEQKLFTEEKQNAATFLKPILIPAMIKYRRMWSPVLVIIS